MKRIVLVAILLLIAGSAFAQQRLNLDFPELAAKASETVDVTLDGTMLRLASKFLSDDDAGEKQARDVISHLTGIYVRSYEFDQDNAYDRGVAERVRAQLGSSWQKLVKVTSKTKENVDIYLDMRGDAVAGMLIICAEPREFTVVNLVGPIDIDKLANIEGEFGIPHVTKSKGGHRD
jgi:hypothetical protein